MPLTRLTIPSSTILTAGSCFTTGTRSCTSPPPPGRAPLRTMRSSRPSSRAAARLNNGRVTVRKTSTEGSSESLVTPRRAMESGCVCVVVGEVRGGWEGGQD